MSFRHFQQVISLGERWKACPSENSDDSDDEEEEEDPFQIAEDDAKCSALPSPWQQQLPTSPSPLLMPLKQAKRQKRSLKLMHVNGINLQSYNNTFYLNNGLALFSSSSVGIVMNTETREQKFFGGGIKSETAHFHTNDILSLDYSQERQVAATGCSGKEPTICIWCPYTLKLVKKFSQGRNTGAVSQLKFSASGSHILSVDNSVKRKIHIFQTATGKEVSTLLVQENIVCVVSGTKFDFAYGSNKGVFTLDNVTKKIVKTQLSKEICTSISVNEAGELFFGTINGMICKLSKQVSAHDGSVTCIHASSGRLVTCGETKFMLKIFDYNFVLLSSCQLQDFCKSIDIFGEKTLLVLRNGKLLEMENDSVTTVLNAHFAGDTWGLAYDPVHEEVITAGDDNKILVYSLSTHTVVNQIKINEKSIDLEVDLSPYSPYVASQMVRALAYNPYNEDLAFVCLTGELQVYETSYVHDPKVVKQVGKGWSQIMRFSPDGKYLAIGFSDGKISVFQSGAYQLVFEKHIFKKNIRNLDWTTTSDIIRVSSSDHVLKYLNLQGEQVSVKAVQNCMWGSFSKFSMESNSVFKDLVAPDFVNQITASHARDALAVGTNNGCVRLYQFPAVSGEYQDYKAHTERVLNLQWSKDDKLLFTVGGYDKAMITWKVI